MKSSQIKTLNTNIGANNTKYVETKRYNELQADLEAAIISPFVVQGFANPLTFDAREKKDFRCITVSGDTTINLINTLDGDAGLIELLITGAGGYALSLGTMFTKDVSGTALDATAAADNFIGWRKVGTDIVYSINQVQ